MIKLAALVVVCAAVASPGVADENLPLRFPDRETFSRFVVEGRTSPFGLDYVFVHSSGAREQPLVDAFCRTVAIRWVNFARLEWNTVEKRPPKGGRHRYDWANVDKAVRVWQRNGVHIMVSLRMYSSWATARPTGDAFVYLKGLPRQLALKSADYLPKPEHMQHFREYVSSLVERYDGDGKEDMPGLIFPVLHYQVGNEYHNELFWAGTAEEYGRLLRETAAAARAACPEVRIILSGIGFRNVYGFYDVGMDPKTERYVQDRLPHVPANMKKFVKRNEAFSLRSAEFTDAYDILDARWPNYGIVAKSRELLATLGCPEKEVWSAEIYSGFPLMEPLVLPNWTLQAWPTPSRSREYLRILKNRRHPKFKEINAWYRGLQAAHVVKICMVALHAGSARLMMGWAVDAQHVLAVSTLSHHGLYSATLRKFWPAAHTYNLLIRKLDGLQSVRRLPMPENAYVYECFVRDDRRVLVAFCDDHVGQNHDQPTAEMDVRIPFAATRANMTRIITEIGRTLPETSQEEVDGDFLRLKLTEYPVFIEPNEPRVSPESGAKNGGAGT